MSDLISKRAVLAKINLWANGELSTDKLIESIKKMSGGSEDAISRQAVIDAIKNYASMLWEKYYEPFPESTIMEMIQDLPSVTPRQKWIPVSERMPEIHQDVLLSLRSLDVEVGFRGNTEPCYYCYSGYIEPQNVLAWQPLPEPYKAEGSDKE